MACSRTDGHTTSAELRHSVVPGSESPGQLGSIPAAPPRRATRSRFLEGEEGFDALTKYVIPEVCAAVGDGLPVRVWIPGCASGEAAYSIAMLVHEQLAAMPYPRPYQIFATDVDTDALQEARQGRYGEAALSVLSPEQREIHFRPDGDGLRVSPALRDACTFAVQDLVRDPPISALDLVVCRNVLGYLQPQERDVALGNLHFALRPGGFLFLGPYDGAFVDSGHFDVVEEACCTFRRRQGVSPLLLWAPAAGAPSAAQDLVAANEELQSVNEELRTTSKELRTSQEQLRSTSRELEAVNTKLVAANDELTTLVGRASQLEMVGVLAGGVAHDFNNLLTALFGFLDLARAGTQPGSSVHDYLDDALAVLERSRALTHQLLTFAKGGKPIKLVVDLKPIVRDAVSFALSGSNVRPRFDLDERLWPCAVDRYQLVQALDNIVLNARQAMSQGGHLFVEARNRELEDAPADGGEVEISIRDTGTGIAPEHLTHIFEPFFSTKRQGSGLGLASVDSIMQSHGGRVEVVSELGKGTTFRMVLPASGEPAAAASLSRPTQAPARPARILVMDDESGVRGVLVATLCRLGHAVGVVDEGSAAVDRYRQAMEVGQPFDAVVLDLTVKGGMGGREAIAKILELDPDATGIVASGYADDPVLSTPADYGFRGRLTKPFTVQEVEQVLADVLA
jgi:signal transduction histidine kinase/ActR/RegA family two-component response regulator